MHNTCQIWGLKENTIKKQTVYSAGKIYAEPAE